MRTGESVFFDQLVPSQAMQPQNWFGQLWKLSHRSLPSMLFCRRAADGSLQTF
jgi:hypothetical protein